MGRGDRPRQALPSTEVQGLPQGVLPLQVPQEAREPKINLAEPIYNGCEQYDRRQAARGTEQVRPRLGRSLRETYETLTRIHSEHARQTEQPVRLHRLACVVSHGRPDQSPA